ncbi:hypothetical protein Tco_0292019 [Tanacetum coccineum]
MPQLMQNLEDSSDPTIAMNKALALIAKAFKINTIPTNNNQRSSLIPCNNQIIQPDINTSQDIKMQMVDDNVGNQVRKMMCRMMGMKLGKMQFRIRFGRVSEGKSSDTQCASNTLDPVSQNLEDENVPLEFQVRSYAKENEHLKTTYKNLFDSIKVTQAQTKSIIDYLQKQLYDTIYQNAKLRAYLFDKASKPKGTTKVTANHDVCVLNYVNEMNSRADNQSVNVSKRKNQKKHKANVKISKELGSKGSLALSRPSKPRTCLRWILTGRIFALCGKLTTSSNTENKSDKSVCDNASTSNPSEPSTKGFSNSTSLLGRLSRLRKQHTSIYPIVVL